MGIQRKKKLNKYKKTVKIVMLVLVLTILAGGTGIYFGFRVVDVSYSGNKHYDNTKMNELLFHGHAPNALMYKLFGKSDTSIPFVQKYDVEIHWPNRMEVTVYEKSIVGYISYMGCKMYFDKDGTVVESSTQDFQDVPEITGLKFQSIVLNSKLDVGNDKVFRQILEMTQAFDKYNLAIDRVYFDPSYNVTLYMGGIKVILGNDEEFTDKLFELHQMSGELTGLKGTLHMENFDGDSKSIIFKRDNS